MYHMDRISYSTNSQKYYRCNQFHYSHIISSGELQDCNWNCNCNLMNSSQQVRRKEREPDRTSITVTGQLRSAN